MKVLYVVFVLLCIFHLYLFINWSSIPTMVTWNAHATKNDTNGELVYAYLEDSKSNSKDDRRGSQSITSAETDTDGNVPDTSYSQNDNDLSDGKAEVISQSTSAGGCTMQDRVNNLQRQCEALGFRTNMTSQEISHSMLTNKIIGRWYIDDRHKLIYCALSKSASTMFRTLLISSASRDDGISITKGMSLNDTFKVHGLKYPKDLTEIELTHRMDNYMKLIIPRHPLDRLVSSYNMCVVRDGTFLNRHLPNSKTLIENHFNKSLPGTSDNNKLSLSQFLQLIGKEPRAFMNGHWSPYMKLCSPCHVKFDYIMRLETIEEDLPVVLDRLGNTDLSQVNNNSKRTTVGDKLKDTSVQFRDISDEVMEGVKGVYGMDMDVFGYTWDRYNGAGCEHVSSEGKCC